MKLVCELLLEWTRSLCVPLVREITFENAEELTEEGKPLIILFHQPDDTDSVKVQNNIMLIKYEKNESLLHVFQTGMRIRVRSDPLIFGPPDPDSVLFSLNPDHGFTKLFSS